MSTEVKKVSRWYFGGVASAGAACCTHPLDLLKVQLQTQTGSKVSLGALTVNIVKQQGILAFYNGLSASLLRQLSYSMVRFGVYDVSKQKMVTKNNGAPLSPGMSVLLAAGGGAAGGFVGTPADLVNVRMQNDIKLPKEQRRNYKHAVDGLFRVLREEGVVRLWSGASMATGRAVLMTVGQLSCYDQIKAFLISTPYFDDNVFLHVTSSLMAGAIATTLTQPMDVLKTRAMNAKLDEAKSLRGLVMSTAREGPLSFFKGYVPAFVRLAPHTILTFVFLEQLRLNFGYTPS